MRRLVRGMKRGTKTAVYRLAKGVAGSFGYDFQVFPRSSRDRSAIDSGQESEFYIEWTTPSAIWAAWLGDGEFRDVYNGIESHTVVSSDRCYVLYCLARRALYLPGDFAECGVYQGGTALLASRVLAGCEKTFFLFDSFEGLPRPDAEKDGPYLSEGVFRATSAEAVKKLASSAHDQVDVRAGWIPETFAGLDERRYAYVHIDVDLYRSTLDCLEYFYPRLTAGAVLVFDDYGFPAARGEKQAVDEFFAAKPEIPIALPTGQALVLKLDQEKPS